MGNMLIAPVADAEERVSSTTFIHAHTGSSPQVDRRIAITDVVTKDANGNAGLGTSTPSLYGRFAVYPVNSTGSENHISTVAGSAGAFTSNLRLGVYPLNGALGCSISAIVNYAANTGTSLAFGTTPVGAAITDSPTERMRITSEGQFRWGNLATIDTVSFLPFQVTGGIVIDTNTTNSQSAMSFFNGQGPNTRVGWIGTIGSSTSYNTSSDITLKKNIADAQDPESIVMSILIRQFDWRVNDEHQRYGAIAQELLDVYPEAVSSGPDDILGVDFSKFIPMMIKHIQLLTARVALLEGAKS
jgi:hypothetical protein